MNSFFRKAMDPISSETHFIGACLSLIGLFPMIIMGFIHHLQLTLMFSLIIFCFSLIALYSASAIYHFFNGNDKIKLILRKLDHSMIYVLIVGTYTPVIMFCMEAPHSYYFLGIMWLIAILGIIMKLCWMNAPRALTTVIYLILGWAIIFDFQSINGIPMHCLLLIVLGGITYSIGAFIYIFKKPNFSQSFGFHELFHIFVMLGSLFHYIAILLLIL
jgi:Predicted membrane protein, hemolysin III homolog